MVPGIRVRCNSKGHLFMPKFGYGQSRDERWYLFPPGGFCFPLLDHQHQVTEHEDGTITIAGEPFETRLGKFRLIAGVWRPEVPAPVQAPAPAEPAAAAEPSPIEPAEAIEPEPAAA